VAPDAAQTQGTSLADKFVAHFPIGAAVEADILSEQQGVIARHFRRLTAENAMKWSELCPREGEYHFARADAIANFARSRSMQMTGHTFVWHQMAPAWLFLDGPGRAAPSLVAQRLQEHIATLMQRYADVVDNWDVVNEAVSPTEGKMWRDASEHSDWHAIFGDESYVVRAFTFASEAADRFAPHTKLYYNDYDIEASGKRHKVIAALRKLRAAGVRIDGVGIQGHINLAWPTADDLRQAIDDFSAEGLLVKISELDVSVYTQDNPFKSVYQREMAYTPELEARLVARYAEVFSVLKERAAQLTSVTLWGISDDRSWLNTWPVRRSNYPLLFGAGHEPKAALSRLMNL
jgi:endo-1,4-beta-xylanase